jgi:hypothetical protein
MSEPKLRIRSPIKADALAASLEKAVAKEVHQLSQLETCKPIEKALEASEENALEKERLELENQRLRDDLGRANDLHGERKGYANRLFWLIVAWLGVVIVFVFNSAYTPETFAIHDNVLIAFITSTTVSVLGLFVVVAKWLFPSPKDTDGKNGGKGKKPKKGKS